MTASDTLQQLAENEVKNVAKKKVKYLPFYFKPNADHSTPTNKFYPNEHSSLHRNQKLSDAAKRASRRGNPT
jgi:hypothetical protein